MALYPITYFLPRGMIHSGWLWFPIEKLKVGEGRVLETVSILGRRRKDNEEKETKSKTLEVSPFDEQLSVSKLQLRLCLASTGMSPCEAALSDLWQTSPVVPGC